LRAAQAASTLALVLAMWELKPGSQNTPGEAPDALMKAIRRVSPLWPVSW
jgi:hypothetical protein